MTLDADTIRTARGEAARSGRRVLDVLEERSGLQAGELVARLAGTLGYRAATMADLERAQSAFDVLPYADAARRGCAPVRGAGGALALAFGDPFAADLRAWAEERIAEPFEWLLAHPADLAVYLARHEEGLRAMDGVVDVAAQESPGEPGAEDLSLVSISEDANPVVKLVNSTLYDAMKRARATSTSSRAPRSSPSSTASTACCRRSRCFRGASTPSRSSRASR